MRRLIDDAPWNFARYRGANRDPGEPVMTDFNLSFAVDGALDTCISLLDYDVPRAHIDLYRGDDEAAAQLAFDVYSELLQAFAAGAGKASDFVHGDEDRPIRWRQMVYEALGGGPWITVTRVSSEPRGAGDVRHVVRVEVDGYDIECIHGVPEDSPWHIMFDGTPLHAGDPDQPKPRPARPKPDRDA
jgi:hypothetical protein